MGDDRIEALREALSEIYEQAYRGRREFFPGDTYLTISRLVIDAIRADDEARRNAG